MARAATKTRTSVSAPLVVGTVLEIDASGVVLVDYPGNQNGPLGARIAISGAVSARDLVSQPVLLHFDPAEPDSPIVIGVVRDKLDARSHHPVGRKSVITRVDGDTVVIDGTREIALRCGKASITLTRDGRVVIRGANIVSRAARTHRIRGGTVSVN